MKFNKAHTATRSPLEGLDAYDQAFRAGTLRKVSLYPSTDSSHPGVWEKLQLRGFSWKGDVEKEPLEVAAFHILPRGLVIDELTRHRKTDQVFVPVTGPLMAVAGPSLEEDPDMPDPDRLSLVAIRPGEAIRVKASTWHTLPFAIVHEVTCMSIIQRETMDAYHDLRDLAAAGWVGIPTWADPKHED